jgi:hypothetical protein
MSRGGKSCHVDADLRHDDFGGSTSNACDGLESFEVGCQWVSELKKPRVALRDERGPVVELRDQLLQKKALISTESTLKGGGQLRLFRAKAATRQGGETNRIGLTSH